jgi:hypothetical protein
VLAASGTLTFLFASDGELAVSLRGRPFSLCIGSALGKASSVPSVGASLSEGSSFRTMGSPYKAPQWWNSIFRNGCRVAPQFAGC